MKPFVYSCNLLIEIMYGVHTELGQPRELGLPNYPLHIELGTFVNTRYTFFYVTEIEHNMW